VKEGERLFDEMSGPCLTPNLEHYTCMIDLFGRAGYFDKVKALLDKVSHAAHLPIYLNVLGSCGKWRDVKLGRWAFDQSIRLDEKCGAAYVCMQNIYAAVGMQIEAYRIELLRARNKAWKVPTNSTWIDAKTNVHSSVLLHQSHPRSRCVYAKLEEIHEKLVQKGILVGLHQTSQTIYNDKEENVMCGHDDKLAIACALINTPKGMPIHITKKVRICRECHSVTSLISMIEERRVIVNDATGAHIFENGRCICD
jgi:pentatricopeptide repeat protein